MGIEIERKFRVAELVVTDDTPRQRLWQGYLSTDRDRTVRVRIKGDTAWLTVKGLTHGATRAEYEYPIPVDDAEQMLRTLCLQPTIDKTRYRIPHAGHTWEVDVFHGVNDGLMVAEVELAREDEVVLLPEWVGDEVTGDPAYYNANLIERPYSTWTHPA